MESSTLAFIGAMFCLFCIAAVTFWGAFYLSKPSN